MSSTEGTNASTGVIEMTNRQRKALDNKLVKFLASAEVKQEVLIADALALIDDCLTNDVWKVAVNGEGNAYENGYSYILDRISAAPNFHKAISHPIAERLLALQDEKGKKVFSVRKVEEATGVSRGVLNEMNQASKRAARPNDGTTETTETGEQESDERIAAKRAVKRLDGSMQAISDTVADMTADEMVTVCAILQATYLQVAEMHKVAGHGDDAALVAAIDALRVAA